MGVIMGEKISARPILKSVSELFRFLDEKNYLNLPDGCTAEELNGILFGGSDVKLTVYENRDKGDYSEKGYFELFKLLTRILTIVRMRKGQQYQGSWCENGEHTVFDNVRRKYNRLENHYIHGHNAQDGESLFDTCGDSGNYNYMLCTWFMVNRTDMFKSWLNDSTILEPKECSFFMDIWEKIMNQYFKGEIENG